MSIKPSWQMLQNFMGKASGDVTELTGAITTQQEIETWRTINTTGYEFSQFHTMLLCYSFGNYEKAELCAQACKPLADHPFGAPDLALVVLYDALTAIETYRATGRRNYLARAQKRLSKMQHWAQHSPTNFLGKQFLIEAELAVAKSNNHSCLVKYTCAVALSREGGFLWQTALACERAGKYCFASGDKENAGSFFHEALALYEEWGATLKVTHLRDEIARLRNDAAE